MDDYIDVVGAQHLWGTVLVVDFSDEVRAVVDLASFMIGPLFDELVANDNVSTFTVDSRLGTLVWPNGLDIAPDSLRAAAALSSDKAPPKHVRSGALGQLALEAGTSKLSDWSSSLGTVARSILVEGLTTLRHEKTPVAPRRRHWDAVHAAVDRDSSFVYLIDAHFPHDRLPLEHGIVVSSDAGVSDWTDEDDEALRRAKL